MLSQEAFGEDGGLTYQFIMTKLKPRLEELCQQAGAPDPRVEFDWYLPSTYKEDAESATEMVCQGSFDIDFEVLPVSSGTAAFAAALRADAHMPSRRFQPRCR